MSVKAKQIEITSPCPITLDRTGITPQDRTMFCAHCTTDVHLLSQLTEPEARDLLKSQAGRDICVSYAIRADGSIRFRPDPALVPTTALTRRPTPAQTEAPRRRMSLVATIGASLLLAACTPHGNDEVVGQVEAKPVIEQPELVEEVPCDDPEVPIAVAGGIRAEPLPPPPPPEQLVDGGIRAEPLPEPPPEPKVDKPKEPKHDGQRKRGGIRARPVDADNPLADL